MEDQVPFKVFTFWNEEEKPEVRRFGVEKSVVTSYHYLNAKLQDVFPGLKNKCYSVSWKDEEGDDVIISSDDEIMIALAAMEDLELVKLYIHCKDKEPKNDVECDILLTTVADSNAACNPKAHYGVICDGCEATVAGFRYKCTTCEDYDLCSRCEAAGLHPDHCMVRVPMPNMPRTVIKAAIKRSRHFLKTVATAIEEEHCKKQRRDKSNERKRRDGHGHGHGHGHRHSSEHHHRRPRTSWLETFANYMNEFANLAGDVNIDTEEKPAQEQAKEKNGQPPNNAGASGKTTREQPTTCPFSVENLDMENIQKLLNLYLGGMNAPPKPSTSNNTEQPNSQPQESGDIDVEIGQGDHVTPEADKESVKSEVSSTPTVGSKREETPEAENVDKADDWTVINKEKDLMDAYVKNDSAQPPIGFNLPEEFQERVRISEGQNLYPPLNIATAVLNTKEPEQPAAPEQPASSQAQASSDKSSPSAPAAEKKEEQPKPQPRNRHPLAHIDAAIEQMISMGFTNDGGWLTQLLESKNGNIPAVLDLLTPVNPKK